VSCSLLRNRTHSASPANLNCGAIWPNFGATRTVPTSNKRITGWLHEFRVSCRNLEFALGKLDARDRELEDAFRVLRSQLRRLVTRISAAEDGRPQVAPNDSSAADELRRQIAAFEKRLSALTSPAEEQVPRRSKSRGGASTK
jgi:hypothetical protein